MSNSIIVKTFLLGISLAAVGYYMGHLTMSPEEQFLAKQVGHTLPIDVSAIHCAARDVKSRSCDVVYFGDDGKTVEVTIPREFDSYPGAALSLSHEIGDPSRSVCQDGCEHSVVVSTGLDYEKVRSPDALKWINTVRERAVAGASAQLHAELDPANTAAAVKATYR